MMGHARTIGVGLALGLIAGAHAAGAEGFDNPSRCAIRHHDIAAALDPATAQLEVTDEILLVHAPAVPGTAATPFLLNRNLGIEEISAAAGGRRVAVHWVERERWEPRDFWARPQYAELDEYGHARQVDLFLAGDRRAASWPESLQVTLRFHGTVYDSLKPPAENYQRGFETTTGLIDPRGAYLAGGTLWYPEHFDDPFTFELTATVPAAWEPVSQGARTTGPGGGRSPHPAAPPAATAGTRTVTWTCAQPMDGIYLVAGPYVLREETRDGVAIQTFTYGNDDEELCRRYLDATRDYLRLYSELIGPYPFPKFALVENFWQTGYGMPSFTLLGDRVVRLPWILGTSYGHEILHNWWGNGVFIDMKSGNWCEGLTVYGADYLYKERESAAAARDYRRTTLQSYLDYTRSGRDFALAEFRERHDAASAAVGYGKAMMLYHMLRRSLGDDAFWRGLSAFYQQYRFRPASWEDLLGVLGRGDLLDPWIARPGAPLLSLAATDLVPRPGGAYELHYVIEQSEPTYTCDVPVRLTYASGPPETWTAHLTGPTFEETRALRARPAALAVDPDFDVFRRLHRAEVPATLSQLQGADSLTFVVAAAQGEALAGACRDLAAEAGRADPAGLAGDEEIALPDLRAGSAWLLGEPRWWTRLAGELPGQLRVEPKRFAIGTQEFDRATHTLVCALPHPTARDEAIGVLLAPDAESAGAVWRKLPHYGAYSYLVFSGAQSVAKGIWEVERSPMVMVWEEEQ